MGQAKSRLDWALRIADLGFYIFRLTPGSKRPPTGYMWKAERTRDPERIREMFAAFPDMNFGVCPGAGGAIIDLDENKGKHGISAYALLEGEQSPTDQIQGLTFETTTPAGGRHLYVTVNEPVTNTHGFGFGIDVRGENGYVVGPGCYFDADKHGDTSKGDISGQYKVLVDRPFMLAPEWQHEGFIDNELRSKPVEELAELDLPSSISQAKQFLAMRVVAIEGMEGDLHTYKTAAVLRRDYAISAETALDLMADYAFLRPTDLPGAQPMSWNDRCDPPWEKYGAMGSLEEKVHNAGRYAVHHQGEKSGSLLIEGLDLAEFADIEKERDQEQIIARSGVEAGYLRGKEIFEILKPPKFIIPNWVLDTGNHALIGKRGIGKSTIALDMALRLAHNMDWHGVETRHDMMVLYLCGEDERGAGSQIRAWCNYYDHPYPDPDRFIFSAGIVDLADQDNVIAHIEAARGSVGTNSTIVFLDTWQRAIASLKQNEDSDMQLAVKRTETIGRSVGGPVVSIYHPPKGDEDTISGSQVQRNTTVAEWFVKEEATGLKLYVDRIKADGRGQYHMLKLQQVRTGVMDDYFGNELTHVIPIRIGGAVMDRDGVTRTDEDMGAVCKAVFAVLRDLESRRVDEYADFGKYYSFAQIVHIIAGDSPRRAGGPPTMVERPESWAVKNTQALKDAGLVVPMRAELFEPLLRKVLAAYPSGYTYPDGRRCYVEKTGRVERVMFDAGGVTPNLTDVI